MHERANQHQTCGQVALNTPAIVIQASELVLPNHFAGCGINRIYSSQTGSGSDSPRPGVDALQLTPKFRTGQSSWP